MRWAAGVGAAMIVIVFAAVSSPAMAAGTSSTRVRNDLVPGDSVPCGYHRFILPVDPTPFVGCPEVAATRLDLDLAHAGCPGAAGGGFTAG